MKPWAPLLIAVGLLTACVPRPMIVGPALEMAAAGTVVFEREEDLELVRTALPAHIKLLETLQVSAPENTQASLLLAQLYGLMAFGFTDWQLETRPDAALAGGPDEPLQLALNRYYRRGAENALQALERRHAGCRRLLSRIDTRQAFIAGLGPGDQPALFWYGFNLAGFVHRNLHSVSALAQAGLALACLERSASIDGSYFHGLAHLVLMVAHASRSPMMGGRPETAEAHYRRWVAMGGEPFTLADVLYARYCLVQRQQREAFERVLHAALSRPAGDGPVAMYNAMGRVRARHYLAIADELFP